MLVELARHLLSELNVFLFDDLVAFGFDLLDYFALLIFGDHVRLDDANGDWFFGGHLKIERKNYINSQKKITDNYKNKKNK